MEKTNNYQKYEKYFEYLCYIFAGLCAIEFFLTPTTRGEVVNFDGSNTALRWEIAFFGWLIVGRITALINKNNNVILEQQPQMPLNNSDAEDEWYDNSSEPQINETKYEIKDFSEHFPNYEQYIDECLAIYKKSNHLDEFKAKLAPIIERINEKTKQEMYKNYQCRISESPNIFRAFFLIQSTHSVNRQYTVCFQRRYY